MRLTNSRQAIQRLPLSETDRASLQVAIMLRRVTDVSADFVARSLGRISPLWHARCIMRLRRRSQCTLLTCFRSQVTSFAQKGIHSCLTEPTLLVVDDEEAICEGCRRIFSRQGFDVRKCSDASQGLNLATHGDYTAILLDIKMPEMDGLALPRSPAQREARRAGGADDRLSQHSQCRVGDSAGRFRLRDQAVHARGNLAGRASLAARRRATRRPSRRRRPPSRPPRESPFRFYRDAWYQATRRRRGARRRDGRAARRHQDRIASACRGSAKWSIRGCRWRP